MTGVGDQFEPLLTIGDLARICSVEVSTVRRWRFDGTAPRGIIVGRHLRFRPEDVREWLDSRQTKGSTRGQRETR